MVTETDLKLRDGRTLHVYDSAGAHEGQGPAGGLLAARDTQPRAPPEPLLPAADRLGIRWVSHDRPGYGGSTPQPGRDLTSVTADVAEIADMLGDRPVPGHGPLRWGRPCPGLWALLPERVLEWSARPGLAPVDADGLD